jgi:hypothetical protein
MPDKPANSISRREFARRAAIVSAVASIAPAGAVSAELPSGTAQTPQPASPASPPAAQPQLPSNMPKLSPESQAEADARFQSILAQYGTRFSDEQKADLRRLCAVAQPQLERLRAYPVQNGDGTALYLKPLFEREKKPKPPAASKPAAPKPANTAAPATATPAAKP